MKPPHPPPNLPIPPQALGGAAAGALLVSLAVWASAFAAIRSALPFYDAGNMVVFRYLTASLGMLALVPFLGVRLPAPRDIPGILLTGFLGYAVISVGITFGSKTVSAAAASILVNAVPIFTAPLAAIFLKERIGTLGWTGIAISFLGAALIALGEGGGVRLAPGAFIVLGGAVSQAVALVFQKPFLARYTAFEFTAWSIWAATLCLLPFFPGLPGAISAAPLSATIAVVWTGVIGVAITSIAYTYALARITASLAASALFLIPAMAMFIAWIWLDEIPTLLSLGGGVVVLSGVAMVMKRPRRRG